MSEFKKYIPCLVKHPLSDIDKGVIIIMEEFESNVEFRKESDIFEELIKIDETENCYPLHDLYWDNTDEILPCLVKGIMGEKNDE